MQSTLPKFAEDKANVKNFIFLKLTSTGRLTTLLATGQDFWIFGVKFIMKTWAHQRSKEYKSKLRSLILYYVFCF